MSDHTADRLLRNRERIIQWWVERATREVSGAKEIKELILRNSLSEFIEQLSVMLSGNDRSSAQKNRDSLVRTQLSRVHGQTRAASPGYLIEEVIFEYHILRQTIFQVLEEEGPLSACDRDAIIDGIEGAVNDAATVFSDTLRDIKERLVVGLTHDLRTPLTAAKTAAELILKRPDNSEFCVKSAMLISDNMKRLDQMIQDILTASRIQAGESLVFEVSEIDLGEIVQEVVDGFSLTHPGRVHYAKTGSSRCIGNAGALKRVLENLLGNALKYGDSSADVWVKIQGSDPEALSVVVHNIGNPIPRDQQAILFEQFRRAKTAESAVGWGLGLMLAKGIVEAHQGSIRVESSKESGTDFVVVLPRAVRHERVA